MRVQSAGRLRRAAAVISVLSVMSMLALASGGQATRGVAQDASHMRVANASDAARAKIEPTLLQAMKASPDSAVRVHVYAKAGTDLSSYMPDAIARAFVDPAGNATITGTIAARNLTKAAGLPGVYSVSPLTGAYAPAADPEQDRANVLRPDADLQAKMTARVANGVQGFNGRGGDIAPTGWYDVLNAHDSTLAWDKGYTGAGVKVMVNDTGTDYANPDLIDTWARVTDPSSPYYGWPEQFDQISMYLWARDVILGESNIAGGGGDYADTSTVISADNAAYQPLDASAPYTYTLPGTSQSGQYHIGTHPDNSLRTWYRIVNGLDLSDPNIADERPAILVVDENTPGVYDTVYVDLNFNHDFTDDKPIRKGDEISGVDWWGAFDPATDDFQPQPDGLYDESGGLVYWISDGVNPIPAADWDYGLGVAGNGQQDKGEPGAGNMVLFAINDVVESPGGDHGTLTASNVVAQGRITGDSYLAAVGGDATGGVNPPYKPDGTGGMVVGASKDVKLVTAGDFYQYGGYDAFAYAALGYDGVAGTDDDIQVMSNSWGHTREVADGWDADSRVIDFYNRALNPTMLITFSAGNEGPGFGSLSGPLPVSALIVGASTEYGSTGWDSATGADQIRYNDAAWFSSRGPSATGTAGVDIMASGARAGGDIPLVEAFSGAHAWETWGGTSRSSPVTAGNAALMYQAYKQANGRWPDYATAKSIMMSSATDLNFDPFIQGAGAVNANRAVDLASGTAGGFVSPSSWSAGDYQGNTWPGFANIMKPGTSSTGTFEVQNPSGNTLNYSVSDRWLQKIGDWSQQWTSQDISTEPITIDPSDPQNTGWDWNMPQYLWNITDLIPSDTDVMVARYDFNFNQLDPNGTYDYTKIQEWQLLAYDWTDVDGDGKLWDDLNGDGSVDPGEIDAGEYVRYDYSRPYNNNAQLTIQRPRERQHDGIFLGLFHRAAVPDIPTTTFNLGLDFYQNQDFPWLQVQDSIQVPAGDSSQIKATVSVPGDTAPGVYEAQILFNDGYWTSVVPVTVNVASRNYNVDAGTNVGNGYYDNSLVRGAQDWSSSYVQGDYRQYFVDLGDNPGGLDSRLPNGTQYFLADVSWQNLPTDINVHLLGPTADDLSAQDPDYYGPYTLSELGKSNDGYVANGAFFTETTSGGPREVVSAPYTPGLNSIVLQNVAYAGVSPSENIQVRAGALSVSQSPITAARTVGNPSYDAQETVISTMPLTGLVAEGFGLGKVETAADVPIAQDDPNDPFTASYQRQIRLDHAGLLDVKVDAQEQDDLDLYVVYDANGDGQFTPDEVIGASTNPAGTDEEVRVSLPADGNYLILVHGWSVPSGSSTFSYTLDAPQGYGISVNNLPSGGIEAGQRYTFDVSIDGSGLDAGTYSGVVTLGPPEGPAAVTIPVTYEIRDGGAVAARANAAAGRWPGGRHNRTPEQTGRTACAPFVVSVGWVRRLRMRADRALSAPTAPGT